MDRFISTDPAAIARLKSGDSLAASRAPSSAVASRSAAACMPDAVCMSDMSESDLTDGELPVASSASKTSARNKCLSLPFLRANKHEFPWLHIPDNNTPAMILYKEQGQLLCLVCNKRLRPTKKTHLVLHHSSKHSTHQDIAAAIEMMQEMGPRTMYIAAGLRLAGLLPNGFDTLRAVQFATMAGALSDAVPERHGVTKHVAKFTTLLHAEICASMAGKPVVLVIDESSSLLDSMRDAPAVMATVIMSLDDASCALLDVTAMKYPDSAAVASYIQRVVNEANLNPSRIVGFMADNVSYMTAAADILKDVPGYEKWQRFRCIAHILNLVVKQLLPACGPIEPILRTMASLWSNGSREVKRALMTVLGSEVTKGNDTRWAHFMEGVEHMLKPMSEERGQLRWFAAADALNGVDARNMSPTAQTLLSQMQQTPIIVGVAVANALLADVPALLRELQGHPMSLSCLRSVHSFFMTLRSPQSIESAVDNALLGAMAQLQAKMEDHCLCVPDCGCYAGGIMDSVAVATLKDSVSKALSTCRDIVARNYLKGMAQLVKQKALTYDSVAADWPSVVKSALAPQMLSKYVRDDLVSAAQYAAVLRSLPARLTQGLHGGDADSFASPSGALDVYCTRVQALPLSSAAVERVFSVMTRLLSDRLRSRMTAPTLLGDIFLMANGGIAKQLLQAAAATAALQAGMVAQQGGKQVMICRAGGKRPRSCAEPSG